MNSSQAPNLERNPWNWAYIFVAVLVLVGFVRFTTNQTDRDKGADADGRQYVTMAGDTVMFGKGFARIAPFCYRVATPWVAKQMPVEETFAKWRLLAFLDVTMVLLLLCALLLTLGFSHWEAMLGMALYGAVFWTVKFSFFSPCYIDHMTQLVTMLILLVMAKGWWPLLPVLVFAGYFQKESVVGLVPVFMVYYLHRKGWKWWPLYVLGFFSLAAAIIPYFILRNNVHPTNLQHGTPIYAISESWKFIAKTPGYPRILLVAIFSGLGLLPLIVVNHLKFGWKYLRENPHWLMMILVGTFFLLGGKDKSRLFLQMLPAVLVLALAAIRDLRNQMSALNFGVWVALLLVLHFFMGNLLTPFRDFDDYLNRMVPEHSPTEGGQGFTRMVLVTFLFVVGNLLLRQRNENLGQK